jgi:ABC-type transport system involved in multi-copper enzyme maturation permease subunit
MRQAFHIFKRDLRQFWYAPIIVALLWAALDYIVVKTDLSGAEQGDSLQSIRVVVYLFLPLAIWFAVVQAVQSEALIGSVQFWLTRPYRRLSLMAAKVLFVIALVCIPLFVSDCTILAFEGFPILPSLTDLSLRFIAVGFWVVLPIAAIAATTRILTQSALFVVGLVIGFLVISFAATAASASHYAITMGSYASIWPFCVLLTGGLAVQYLRRTTVFATCMVVAAFLALLRPLFMAPLFYSPVATTSFLVDKPNAQMEAPPGGVLSIGQSAGSEALVGTMPGSQLSNDTSMQLPVVIRTPLRHARLSVVQWRMVLLLPLQRKIETTSAPGSVTKIGPDQYVFNENPPIGCTGCTG